MSVRQPPASPLVEGKPAGSTAISHRSGEIAVAPVYLRHLTLDAVPAEKTSSFKRLRRSMLIGTLSVFVFAGLLSVFMAKTVIAGAVVSHGTLVVESGPKKVQHSTGGIVRELLVSEGDEVKVGQPLIVLDQVVTDAQLKAVATGLVQKQARLDRLIAERDGADTLTFPSVPPAVLLRNTDYESFLDMERRQFDLRREGRDGQRKQLTERVNQTQEQIKGDTAQLDAVSQETKVVEGELDGLRNLFKKKLVTYQRLSEMERTLSQLQGQQGSLQSSIAGSRGKMAEIELQILQVDQNLRSELTDQIAETQQSVSELAERQIIANDARVRSVITAPQDGVVHELTVHTVGGVVQPAETLMLVVPESDRLVGEVRIAPADIDQLYPGQKAEIHFSAFDRGTTPSINGELARVSPDLEQDPRTGAMFYKARITAGDDELARLGDLKLIAGMPLEVFIRTSERTIASYLTKPLADQMNRSFR